MPTTCSAYWTEDEAQAAVDRLLATGVPGDRVRVLMGAPIRDHRDERVGHFAAHGEDDRVGAFAGSPGTSREAMGSFAGDPDAQRRGGFGDLDRETVTSYRDGVPRIHVASHRNLEKMLVEAGLDEDAAEADVKALHDGRVLVLVRTV
jgi:hypothetical protein